MKKILALSILIILILSVTAHEFWLEPKRFWFQINDTAVISFKVGEHFVGDNWKGNQTKVNQLFHYSPSAVTDIKSSLSESNGDSLKLSPKEEGTHMITFNSTNSFIEIEAAKFNDYLKDDGITNTLAYRKEHNEMNKKGTEYYQRSVKTLLNVGVQKTTNQITKPTTLPLDIIPSANPYATINTSQKIEFTVLFKGKPLVNQEIKVWNRKQKESVIEINILTDANGKFKYRIDKAGSGVWMFSTVFMERNASDSKADWQSYWGSLTFGYGNFFMKKS